MTALFGFAVKGNVHGCAAPLVFILAALRGFRRVAPPIP
uniref:Uncharacterized protein n=1 Tax=Morganella morganii TaxID=582 RepID=A0A6B8DIZ2_MORMO|nr:hypothetical protein [Morganella morganii]